MAARPTRILILGGGFGGIYTALRLERRWPRDRAIEITLETQREEVYLTLDGQEGTSIGYRDVVRISRSTARIRLIKVSDRGFYDSLRGKLRWGGLDGAGSTEP